MDVVHFACAAPACVVNFGAAVTAGGDTVRLPFPPADTE